MDVKGKQLAQARPANTTAVSAYTPPSAEIVTEIRKIIICNTTASAATFRLFHDDNGTTYDETTALYFDDSVPANKTVTIQYPVGCGLWMDDDTGNLAVRTGTGSALTFTIYGDEHNDDIRN